MLEPSPSSLCKF